jgi:hypothetical protein
LWYERNFMHKLSWPSFWSNELVSSDAARSLADDHERLSPTFEPQDVFPAAIPIQIKVPRIPFALRSLAAEPDVLDQPASGPSSTRATLAPSPGVIESTFGLPRQFGCLNWSALEWVATIERDRPFARRGRFASCRYAA